MRTAEAMRHTGGDPLVSELSGVVGSACLGARVLSLARVASAVHMAEVALRRADAAGSAPARSSGMEAAR